MRKVSATLLSNKRKKENDAGFGALNSTRLINKNGTANVNRIGVPFSQRFSLYHYLIGISWVHFLGLIFAFYFVANLFFASLYIAIGVEQLSGANVQSCGLLFWDAFFFSAQTLSTVGYGHIAPVGFGANVLSSIEALLGLLVFALITGLGYGRFAKPDASLIVSKNMLIAPYLDGQGLMFRFGNARNESLIEAEVEMMFSYLPQNKEAKAPRTFLKLNLERSKIGMLSQTWTVVHPIDEDSPLKEMNPEILTNSDAEVIVFFKAFDEKFNQTVHRRFSFTHHEIVWNAKFTSVLSLDEASGNIQVDFNKINEYDTLN
ncbi:MAG: ion channel [Bacteroidia bacterium]